MALKYSELSPETQERIACDRKNGIRNPYRTDDSAALRRVSGHDSPTLWRPAFVRDCEKILHLPIYNRYSDKTQVLSFYKNDDITRRALHVQFVSRIARNIGSILGLNTDLIEAIALGHDIGHTPFGHAGEQFLNDLLFNETGRHFDHNVQSVRVLDRIFARNLSLQTLDGILCHNGEFEMKEYSPCAPFGFDEFDRKVDSCTSKGVPAIRRLIPCTLEGCVVRVSDMIAYIGKDRQDARTANIIDDSVSFNDSFLGTENAEIINNLVVDIIEHSYQKGCISLSDRSFEALRTAKKENYEKIYLSEKTRGDYEECIRPMFAEVYYKLLADLKSGDEGSVIFRHHINYVLEHTRYYEHSDYLNEDPNSIVADFIACMTDDYFLDLYEYLFPNGKYSVDYVPYFQ